MHIFKLANTKIINNGFASLNVDGDGDGDGYKIRIYT
jgi:hypothetical protein